jgi:hypothetical protein
MDLDSATDELYGARLEDFVSERTRLVKELRDAGDREGAQALAKLRKPVLPAWVLNQLTRRSRRDVDLLLDAGHRLREAQAGVLGGDERAAFEQARTIERDALRRLLADAERILEEERGGGSAGVLSQVEQSLRAAAISEEGRETLALGRFVEPPEPAGFEVMTALAASVPAGRKPRPKTPGRAQRDAAAAALKEAKAALREAERDAREAERRAEAAHADAARADAEAERAGEDVERARRAVERLSGT